MRSAHDIALGILGAPTFWTEVRSLKDCAAQEGRTYRIPCDCVGKLHCTNPEVLGRQRFHHVGWLTYEEWDYVFERAVELGIMAVHADQQGEAHARFANPIALGMLRFWRAMRRARSQGVEPMDFAIAYDDELENDHRDEVARSNENDRLRAQRIRDFEETRRNPKTKLAPSKTAAGSF